MDKFDKRQTVTSTGKGFPLTGKGETDQSLPQYKAVSVSESPPARFSEQAPKYKVLERLAVGGMAELFLAELESLHGFRKKVVIKKLLPQYASDENFIEMFLDEARLVARLNHPSIVQGFDIGQGDDGVFFTMEYVEGFTISEILRLCAKLNRPLQVEEVLAIMIPVAEALEHAHGFCDEDGNPMDLVHRDVSPSNIIVTTKGRVKLLDFGVAKSNSQICLTVGNSIKGKFGYMAPEQTKGLDLDKRCDIFSFGVVLWELLAGRRLFPGGVDHLVLSKILQQDAPLPSSVRDSLPPVLDDICAKALARNRDERYSDLGDFLVDIASFEISMNTARTSRTLTALIEELYPSGRVSKPLTNEESIRLSMPLTRTGIAEPHSLEDSSSGASASGASASGASASLEPTSSINKGLVDQAALEITEPTRRNTYIVIAVCLLAAVVLLLLLLREGPRTPKELAVVKGFAPGAASVPKTPEPSPQSDNLLVILEVKPSSASIEIDGKLVGIGNYSEPLAADETHSIRVFADGYEDFRTTFQGAAPEKQIVLVKSPGSTSDDTETKLRHPKPRRSKNQVKDIETKSAGEDATPAPLPNERVRNPSKVDIGGRSDNLDPWK